MNKKKIVAGLLSLTLVFGGAILPNVVVDNAVISSSAEVLTFGDYEYTMLEDGTIGIIKYYGSETEVEVPSQIKCYDGTEINVTAICANAFSDSDSIEIITLPEKLKYIDEHAFGGCSKIKNIVIPDDVEYINEMAFWGCDSLKSITLSKGLKNIGDNAFSSCANIKSVVIPDGVERIERGTFSGCAGIESISFSGNLEYIGAFAFAGCRSMKNVVIPDSVKTIDNSAFVLCEGLEIITIPESVTSIGKNAFTHYDNKAREYKPLKNLTINCYGGSYAEKYAKANGLKYKLIDEPNCPHPKKMFIKAAVSEEYHQIRLNWNPVVNAEKYGIAVYLAGKWRVWTSDIPADVTVFTSPKNLTPGRTYQLAVAVKVNGKWDIANAIKNAVTITIK